MSVIVGINWAKYLLFARLHNQMMDTKMDNTNHQSQTTFKGRLQVSILSAYLKAINLIETVIENDLIIPACPLKLSFILSKRLPTVFAKSSSAGYRVNWLSIWHLIQRLSRIWQDCSRPFERSVYCCPLLSSSNWMPRSGPTSTLHKLLIYSK